MQVYAQHVDYHELGRGTGYVTPESLVNAGAIVKYLIDLDPDHVSLVAMGYRTLLSAEEDLLCAEYIANGLTGSKNISEQRIAGLMNTAGLRFFKPENMNFSPPTDFFLCTMLNRFNFVLKGEKRIDGNIDLRKIDL